MLKGCFRSSSADLGPHCRFLLVVHYPSERFDTVLMNPPFGTRRAGIDVIFLERALEVCPPDVTLYDVDNTETASNKSVPSFIFST